MRRHYHLAQYVYVQIAQSASEGQNENEDEITHQFQRSFAVSRIDQESASNGIEVARTVSPTRGPLTPPNATINASPVDYQPSVPADHQRESLDKTKEYDRGPPHTEERPNWALAPEDPPDMIPTGSATRGRGRGRGRGGLRGRGRGRNNEGRGGNGGRRGRGSRSRSLFFRRKRRSGSLVFCRQRAGGRVNISVSANVIEFRIAKHFIENRFHNTRQSG